MVMVIIGDFNSTDKLYAQNLEVENPRADESTMTSVEPSARHKRPHMTALVRVPIGTKMLILKAKK